MFLSHGEACTKIEAEALDLISTAHEQDDHLRVYNEMLENLRKFEIKFAPATIPHALIVEQLQEKAALLESTISRLVATDQGEEQQSKTEPDKNTINSKIVAHSELERVFAACLPVLRARVANLTIAQDLIDSAQENLSISLRMEHLGID
jgi:hypothetical protein